LYTKPHPLCKHCVCSRNFSGAAEISHSPSLWKPTKESLQGSISGNPPEELFKHLLIETPLWHSAMSTSLKSLPKGLIDLECEKGTLTMQLFIPYVPPIDLHERRIPSKLRSSYLMGLIFRCPLLANIRSRKQGDTDGTSNIVLPCPGS
jgi:hypothetical protein